MAISASELKRRLQGFADDVQGREETLRYLGYKGQALSDEVDGRIREAMGAVVRSARPACCLRAFAADELPLGLPGKDIAEHLRGAREVVLVAATLGVRVDVELRRLKVEDPLLQVLFDAAASAAIEYVVDLIEVDVRASARERGLFCSSRFSPGYGDLPLEVQPRFLAVLDAGRRLGISLTETNLMVPTKSVTCIIGIHREAQGSQNSCSVCSLERLCSMRGRGFTCRGPVPK